MTASINRRTALFGSLLAASALTNSSAKAQSTESPKWFRPLVDLELTYGGRLGVAILDTATGKRIEHRANEHFALCSTFKWLAAAFVLARVDRKEEHLDRRIVIAKSDLVTWSPITEKRIGKPGIVHMATIIDSLLVKLGLDSSEFEAKKSKVDKGLAKLIEPIGNLLSAVYFDVDGGKEIDHSDGSAYDLKIVLAYPPGDDPEQTADEVEKLETSIEDLFSKKHFDQATGKWNGIALKACMSISEDDLRVSKARRLTQWRLEYMTLKADDEQPGAPV